MFISLINFVVFYIFLPLSLLFLIFNLLILNKHINELWLSYLFRLISPRAAPYFATLRKQLFSDISELNSSDPILRKENSIRILEVGAGTGPNFEYYPKNCRLITVDKNVNFKAPLLRNVSKYPHIILENAFVAKGEDMRECVEDSYCDVVVLSHLLCSADDHIAILNEAYRTLRKGGVLYILEHIRYRNELYFNIQRLIDPIWTRILGGCHITRDINEQTLKSIGFSGIDLKYLEVNIRNPYLFWFFWFIQPTIIGKLVK